MKKKFFLVTAVLLAVFLSGCNQKIETTKNVKNPPAPPADTKHKVTVTQPANGKIEVTPALPADSMVTNGSELTFTLSANKGYKVKTLTIGGTAYSDVTDKRITKKIKIEKNTSVSATVEEDTENPPAPPADTKHKVTVTQPANGSIQVTPALPADGMVPNGSELTFTLSANTGFKVKTLTIGGTAYSDVTDNRITKKVKIEKDTEVSAVVEAETNPTQPNSDYENKDNGSSVEITANENDTTTIKLKGDIYIDDLISNEFKEKLKDKKNINTNNLNINCFKPKTNNISGQSIAIKNTADNFEAKKITPKILKDILELKKSKNFSELKLNNKSSKGDIIEILFASNKEEYFDITDLKIFNFNKEFKLKENSSIYLKADRKEKIDGNNNDTPFAKTTELVEILKNKTLQNYITIGDVYVSGQVNELLPYLAGSKGIKFKEEDGGVKFLDHEKFTCNSVNFTYFNNGELSLNELLEFRRRTDACQDIEETSDGKKIEKWVKSIYLKNTTLKNIDSTKITNKEDLKLLNFECDELDGNIVFEGGNLSKIYIQDTIANTTTTTFKNIVLPYDMYGTSFGNLKLQDVTFPKQKIKEYIDAAPVQIGITLLNAMVPKIEGKLTISGYVKDSPFDDKNLFPQTKLDKLSDDEKIYDMPKSYEGPEDIYNNLKKYLYSGESEKTKFTTQSADRDKKVSLNKPLHRSQDQLLAILKKRKERSHG